MTALELFTIALTLSSIVTLSEALRVRRVGGLLFWRLGRLGGSLYLARARRNHEEA